MNWNECSCCKPVPESIDDQFFRLAVSQIPSDTYFRLCYVADLLDIHVSLLVRMLLILLCSSVVLCSSDPHFSFVRLEDILSLEV